MKSSILILALCLLTQVTFACDSFEKCIEDSKFHMKSSQVANFAEQAQAEALQAIAYKLDEISKKLPTIYELSGPKSDPNSKWVKKND